MIQRLFDLAALTCGCALAALLFAASIAPTSHFMLERGKIAAEEGYAFKYEVPRPFKGPFAMRSDRDGFEASTLRVFEDGSELGAAHVSGTLVRQHGSGRFLHWGSNLYFSSSDNSDPRTNGRRYAISAKAVVPASLIAGLAALLMAMIAGSRWRGRCVQWLDRLGSATNAARMNLIQWLVVLAASAAPLWLVVDAWNGGKPLIYALGGYFPLTDGAIYWLCSLQLAALGDVPGPFGWVTFLSSGYCTNRPSHTGLLATLQLLAGFDPHVLLLLLGLIIGAGMAYLSLEVARTFGWVAAAVTYVLVLAYASEHVLSMFTSESSGLFLGLLGVGLLVRFVRTDAWSDALLGSATLSIGLFTRAGAMLALPLLMFWIVWQAEHLRGRERYAFLAKGISCISAGYFLQRALLALIGDPSGGYFSNFSVVLYALATGSRNWREALVIHGVETPPPVETLNMVLPMAISKVLEQPGTFFTSLAAAEHDYLATLFQLRSVQAIDSWLMALLAIGAVRIAFSMRRRGCQALLVIALGEVLSAPFIFDADGLRVFATTFPIRCLLAGVAVSMLCRLLAAAIHPHSMQRMLVDAATMPRDQTLASSATWWPPAVALAGVALATLFAATPLARPFRLNPVPVGDAACPDNTSPVVMIANRASTALFIGGESSAHRRSGTASVATLDHEIRDAWFKDDFARLPHNTLLLRGIDRNPSNFGREVSMLWLNADPTVRDGDVLRLCLLPHLTRPPHRRFVRLAFHRFFLASPAPPTVTRAE